MKFHVTIVVFGFYLAHSSAAELAEFPSTLFAAGDIADCGPGAALTARFLEKQSGLVLALGDLAYPDAGREDFKNCYEPTWGRLKGRVRSVPGNHEYMTEGAKSYFAAMGEAAGPSGKGYYSFELNGWHIIGLNSHIRIGDKSKQINWLQEDLSKTTAKCILAFTHLPRFSSGEGGDNEEMEKAWLLLQGAGATLMLAGHDHHYERFAPLNVTGGRDNAKGIRSFVVGTGGAYLDKKPWWQRRHSERLIPGQWGVLKIDLASAGYNWAFISVDGKILDSGSDQCRRQ